MSIELTGLESRLAVEWPPSDWVEVTVILAVSGGPDSVALLRAMAILKTGGAGRMLAAHFNHRLRGHEASEDEAFVLELCNRLGVPCQVGYPPDDWQSARAGDGLEALARKSRYDFLQWTASRLGARYVVTAHTADDQAETILHRILRGTGITGLAGMSRARPLGPACTLIRPLLRFRRAELLDYLDRLGQPYRRDSSNADLRFTRNRIRHQLLPQVAQAFNPNVVDAVLRLGLLAGEVKDLVDGIVGDLLDRYVAFHPSGVVGIDAPGFGDQPRYVLRELLIAVWRRQGWPLQSMGFAEWEDLALMLLASSQIATSPPTKRVFPGNVLAESAGGVLRLACQGT
jgi:tRNA(Ile)-lysidine synthase